MQTFAHRCSLSATMMIAFSTSITASAQIVIQGDGAPRACYLSVKAGDQGRPATIKKCLDALESYDLSLKNRTALHTNIGILYMRAGKYEKATAWFDTSIALAPKTAETYINYAAALIHSNDFTGAIKMANIALEYNPTREKNPEALYNRAIAYDRLEKHGHAYRSLKQALELRPDWPPALKAIDNYEVSTKTNG